MINFLRRWRLHRRIRKARKLLILIDAGVKKVGMPRAARRRMWHDFATMNDGHQDILDLLSRV